MSRARYEKSACIVILLASYHSFAFNLTEAEGIYLITSGVPDEPKVRYITDKTISILSIFGCKAHTKGLINALYKNFFIKLRYLILVQSGCSCIFNHIADVLFSSIV